MFGYLTADRSTTTRDGWREVDRSRPEEVEKLEEGPHPLDQVNDSQGFQTFEVIFFWS